MRNPTACAQCRRAKRRCIRQKANEACTSCRLRQLVCEGRTPTQRTGQWHLAPRSLECRAVGTASARPTSGYCGSGQQHQASNTPETSLGSTSKQGLSRGMAIELVEHYLEKFDGRPHSIFHPATLRSQVRSGTLNQAVLYAICAIGCKFSVNPDTQAQGAHLAVESKRLLQVDLSNICLENIQACILIALLSVGHGDSASEALFFRMYCNMPMPRI